MVNRILVIGVARSGTTWTAEVLGRAPGAVLVSEPDNGSSDIFAGVGKLGLGFLPALEPDERAPRYQTLWELAFAGGWPASRAVMALRGRLVRLPFNARMNVLTGLAWAAARRGRTAETVVVKSVYAPLTIDWILKRFDARIVLVRRHPLNILASWLELGMPPYPIAHHPVVRRRLLEPYGLAVPQADASNVTRLAWTIGLVSLALEDAARRHHDWVVVRHEALCAEPVAEFARLYERVGLPWSDELGRHVVASNRPGRRFETTRVTGELPQAWRRRLTAEQVAEAEAALAMFPDTSARR